MSNLNIFRNMLATSNNSGNGNFNNIKINNANCNELFVNGISFDKFSSNNLMSITTIPNGSPNCPDGGINVKVYVDRNDNNKVDQSELLQSINLCNGLTILSSTFNCPPKEGCILVYNSNNSSVGVSNKIKTGNNDISFNALTNFSGIFNSVSQIFNLGNLSNSVDLFGSGVSLPSGTFNSTNINLKSNVTLTSDSVNIGNSTGTVNLISNNLDVKGDLNAGNSNNDFYINSNNLCLNKDNYSTSFNSSNTLNIFSANTNINKTFGVNTLANNSNTYFTSNNLNLIVSNSCDITASNKINVSANTLNINSSGNDSGITVFNNNTGSFNLTSDNINFNTESINIGNTNGVSNVLLSGSNINIGNQTSSFNIGSIGILIGDLCLFGSNIVTSSFSFNNGFDFTVNSSNSIDLCDTVSLCANNNLFIKGGKSNFVANNIKVGNQQTNLSMSGSTVNIGTNFGKVIIDNTNTNTINLNGTNLISSKCTTFNTNGNLNIDSNSVFFTSNSQSNIINLGNNTYSDITFNGISNLFYPKNSFAISLDNISSTLGIVGNTVNLSSDNDTSGFFFGSNSLISKLNINSGNLGSVNINKTFGKTDIYSNTFNFNSSINNVNTNNGNVNIGNNQSKINLYNDFVLEGDNMFTGSVVSKMDFNASVVDIHNPNFLSNINLDGSSININSNPNSGNTTIGSSSSLAKFNSNNNIFNNLQFSSNINGIVCIDYLNNKIISQNPLFKVSGNNININDTSNFPVELTGSSLNLNINNLPNKTTEQNVLFYNNGNISYGQINNSSFDNYYGNGADGDITISGNVTLSRDMFYNNLTVTQSGVLTTAGYRIFVKNTLIVNGTIRNNAVSNASLNSPGIGALGGVGCSFNPGGNGRLSGGANTAFSTVLFTNFTTICKGGDAGSVAAPGVGFNSSNNSTNINMITKPLTIVTSLNQRIDIAGGSGGAAQTIADGSAGGGGGGVVSICCRSISGTGFIEAKGSNAFSSGTPAGGGGGGTIIVKSDSFISANQAAVTNLIGTSITLNVSGGLGATGGNNGNFGYIAIF